MSRIKIYTMALLCSLALGASAQQEEQYTQFMYYKLGFNPAYAGSNENACISLLARNQWIGVDGAPQSQLITFNMPLLNQRLGIGATIARQSIGVTERYNADLSYAYRVRAGRGMLSFGLQGSVRFLRVNFSQTEGTQPNDTDVAIPGDMQSKYLPNFGAGIYYNNKRFYVGASLPRLLTNNIDFADEDLTISKEVRHIYLMGGLLIDLSEQVQMQPQTLLKYVAGAPFDADVNLNFIFSERFTTGISYRLGGSSRRNIGESLSLVLGAQITNGLLLGFSYDMTLSELRDHNSGTIEAMLRFCIGERSSGTDFVNPRFF